MSIRTVIQKIISSLLLFNIVKRYKGRSSLMKIRAAQAYVVGVKKTRIFFLGVLYVILSFLLLGSGLFLIHTALFSYSLWDPQVKFTVALVLGGIEFSVAIFIFLYLFREETWVKFFAVANVINSVVKDKSDRKS